METIRMKKTIVALGLIFFVLVLFSSEGLTANAHNKIVTIMTQNMDSGTDLGFVLASLGAPESVDLTLAEIRASNIPERANLLAEQIATEQPHIVALEEVTLWRIGPTPETATRTLYDQLELLLSALKDHEVAYEVVAINRLTDLALAGTEGAVRYTDRNVLLWYVLICARLHFTYPTSTPAFMMQRLISRDGPCIRVGFPPMCTWAMTISAWS
jgi:hypothetical protein